MECKLGKPFPQLTTNRVAVKIGWNDYRTINGTEENQELNQQNTSKYDPTVIILEWICL